MFKIQIRFNTVHNGNGLLWRVLINGVEHLASEVQAMNTGFKTSTDEIGTDAEGNKIFKQHITILTANEPVWNGTVVFLS
jgi:hypothetical protein